MNNKNSIYTSYNISYCYDCGDLIYIKEATAYIINTDSDQRMNEMRYKCKSCERKRKLKQLLND